VPENTKGQFALKIKYNTAPFESKIVDSTLTLK